MVGQRGLNLTKTPYLVLFILLAAAGVGTASALITITFEGLTIFKENVQFDKDVNIDGIVTGQAITDFQNQIDNNEARITDIELFLEERSDFWEFLEESGEKFFEPQVYEVSGVSIISANEVFGTLVELRCLDGDWFRTTNLISSIPFPFPTNGAIINVPTPAVYHESDNTVVLSTKVIGVDARAQNQGVLQPFEFQVLVFGICLSPSP